MAKNGKNQSQPRQFKPRFKSSLTKTCRPCVKLLILKKWRRKSNWCNGSEIEVWTMDSRNQWAGYRRTKWTMVGQNIITHKSVAHAAVDYTRKQRSVTEIFCTNTDRLLSTHNLHGAGNNDKQLNLSVMRLECKPSFSMQPWHRASATSRGVAGIWLVEQGLTPHST